MEKRCINCKRDLNKGQKECFICGSPQSFFRYHFSTLLVFLILFSLMMVTAFWYFEQQLQIIQQRNIETNQLNSQTAKLKITQLEEQLQFAKQQINQIGQNKSQSTDALAEEKLKTEKVLAKVTEVEKRASWLSKENRQFKKTIKQLKEQLASANEVSTPPPQTLPTLKTQPQFASNQEKIEQLEKQKQDLVTQVNLIKADLQKTWQQQSDASGVTPDALTLTAREQQLNDATVIETQKILDIEEKIAALKKP